MAVLRGLTILLISLLLIILETYYLIIQPILAGVKFEVSTRQYWAIAIPVFAIVMLICLISLWLGYTILTTPEPIRLDYEEAYEIAEANETARKT